MKFDITNNEKQIKDLYNLKKKATDYCKNSDFDIEKSIKMFEIAYKMYQMYISTNQDEAYKLDMDIMDICISIGDLYIKKNNNVDLSFKWYEKAGFMGFDRIGDMYFFGKLVDKDIVKALNYYKKDLDKAKKYDFYNPMKLGYCSLLLNNIDEALIYFNEKEVYLQGCIEEIACRIGIAYINNDTDTINTLFFDIEGIDGWPSFVCEFVSKK